MLEELEVWDDCEDWDAWVDWDDWEEEDEDEETTAGLRWDSRLPSSDCSDRYGAGRGRGGREREKLRLGTDGDESPLRFGRA